MTRKFIERAQVVHNYIYDYSKVNYVSVDHKVEIVCPTHGSFFQTPRNHLYKKSGCNACAVDRSKKTNTKTTEQFIMEAMNVHEGKYDYTNVNYVNAVTPVEIVCPTHGSFFQLPSSHTSKRTGCKKCAVRGDQEWFKMRAREVHHDRYDYSCVDCVTGKGKVVIICDIHGKFEQRAESHLVGCGCPVCGAESKSFSSAAENEIASMIEACGFVWKR